MQLFVSKPANINRLASRINIQNACTYICKRNTIVNGDKNGAHVACCWKKIIRKKHRFIIKVSNRIEHVWFMFQNDNFNAEICTPLVINRTYIALCIINTLWKMNQKIPHRTLALPPLLFYIARLLFIIFCLLSGPLVYIVIVDIFYVPPLLINVEIFPTVYLKISYQTLGNVRFIECIEHENRSVKFFYVKRPVFAPKSYFVPLYKLTIQTVMQ